MFDDDLNHLNKPFIHKTESDHKTENVVQSIKQDFGLDNQDVKRNSDEGDEKFDYNILNKCYQCNKMFTGKD